MSRLRVAPIVEGHGEVESVRALVGRIWREIGGDYVEVLAPVREKKDRLVDKRNGRIKAENLERSLVLAWEKLINPPRPTDPTLVLILLDADDHCPATIGPGFIAEARRLLPAEADVACVLANVEYETWFAASAESLTKYLDLPQGFVASDDPEAARHGKAWVMKHFRGLS